MVWPMSEPADIPRPAPGGLSLRVVTAWVAIALIPVAYLAGSATGRRIFELAGYSASGTHPIGITLMVALPVLLVRLLPVILAVWLSAAAVNAGDSRGELPLRISLILGLALVGLAAAGLMFALLAVGVRT